jgi:hypothetical protein
MLAIQTLWGRRLISGLSGLTPSKRGLGGGLGEPELVGANQQVPREGKHGGDQSANGENHHCAYTQRARTELTSSGRGHCTDLTPRDQASRHFSS